MGEIPVALFVRSGAVIPHAALAQSTSEIDWNSLELRVFGPISATSVAEVALPGGAVQRIQLSLSNGASMIQSDPYEGRITWRVVTPTP
jgi:alpha-D-xyloside xylohydrolase